MATDSMIETLDWQDSNKVFAFGMETINVARDYQQARKTYATAIKRLKIGLAHAYKENKIERKTAEPKAFVILANESDLFKEALLDMIESEHEYKGLEKVLETRQAITSLAQSLIRNMPKQ